MRYLLYIITISVLLIGCEAKVNVKSGAATQPAASAV